jgi:HAD superfamily hydrolase (TIGR01509 family)
MPSMKNWAAIFDWDGVIVDSSRAHEASWERLAAELHRVLPPEHFRNSFGMRNEQIIPELLHWTDDPGQIRNMSLRKEALFREIIREEGIAPLPGVAAWLAALRAANVPCIIASSTHRENITCTLGVIGLENCFTGIVASEDVTRGKPEPDVFLLAAKKVNAPPQRCVVFEDAHVGIEAARRAKMRVVGVATTHPADSLVGASRVVRRLDELSVAELSRWFDGATGL